MVAEILASTTKTISGRQGHHHDDATSVVEAGDLRLGEGGGQDQWVVAHTGRGIEPGEGVWVGDAVVDEGGVAAVGEGGLEEGGDGGRVEGVVVVVMVVVFVDLAVRVAGVGGSESEVVAVVVVFVSAVVVVCAIVVVSAIVVRLARILAVFFIAAEIRAVGKRVFCVIIIVRLLPQSATTQRASVSEH